MSIKFKLSEVSANVLGLTHSRNVFWLFRCVCHCKLGQGKTYTCTALLLYYMAVGTLCATVGGIYNYYVLPSYFVHQFFHFVFPNVVIVCGVHAIKSYISLKPVPINILYNILYLNVVSYKYYTKLSINNTTPGGHKPCISRPAFQVDADIRFV